MKIHSTATTFFIGLFLFCCFVSTINAQTSDITEGCLPLEVSFNGPAGQSAYYWDFKDGAFATTQNATNTFGAAGSYEVELRQGQNGAVVGTITINVYEKPVITIVGDPAGGCAPLNTTLSATIDADPAINVTAYQWSFGDGQSGNGPTPLHTYTDLGTYDVGLEISTNLTGCDITEFSPEVIAVSGVPSVSFTTSPNPPISCTAPLDVTFNNTTNPAGLTFEWDFGNGQTSSETNPGTITYTTEGSFTATLTATDNIGCSRTITRNINIGNPVASFEVPDTVCVGQPFIIENESTIGAYNWDLGNGETSTAGSPTVAYDTPGLKTITLNVTAAGGCTGDTMVTLFAEEVPEGFTTLPDFSCEEPLSVALSPEYMNPDAMYEWTIVYIDPFPATPDSILLTSEEMSPTFDFFNPDTTIYGRNGRLIIQTSYMATSPAGCVVSGTMIDTLWQPNALFMPDVVDGCAPLAVTFADSSTAFSNIVGYTYLYDDGNMASFTNDDPHTYTFNDPGEYDVRLVIETENGCLDTSYAVRIEVGSPLTPDFTADQTTVCPGDTVLFTGISNTGNIDAWHFHAEEGRGSHCFNDNEMRYNFDNTTGPQDITLEVEYNGCFSEVTKTDFITVNGPLAKMNFQTNCDNPFNVAFEDLSSGATTVTWAFGDSTSSTVSNTSHLYDSTGTYMVYLTAENNTTGCPASVDSALVHVTDIRAGMELLNEEMEEDSMFCIGEPIFLKAQNSQDVDNRCWKGYDWHFSWKRPITTPLDTLDESASAPGDQTISLVVTDINGCRDTTSRELWVFSSQPDFTLSEDVICIPSPELSFSEMSTSDTTLVKWEWDFGDGGMATGQTATHAYTTSPFPEGSNDVSITVPVTLFVEDVMGCSETVTKNITVYEPRINLLADPTNICSGAEVAFNTTDFEFPAGTNRPVTYSWDFGNGTTSTNRMDTVQYDGAGTYNVNLNIVEIATGCQNIRPLNPLAINVQGYPDASFTTNVDGQDPICYPAIIEFADNSVTSDPLTQMWDFGNGATSNDLDPSITFDKGTYTVEMIVSTSFGCMDTVSRSFTLVGPEGDFIVDNNLVCLGEPINFEVQNTVDISSFRWEFGDGDIVQGGDMVTHEYQSGGTFTAELILTGVSGICETTLTEQITVQDLAADFTVMDACFGPIQFLDNSSNLVTNYFYDFGDGSNSTDEDPVHTFAAPGVQTVELLVESAIGCMDSVTQTVEVFPLPAPIVDDAGGCQDSDIALSVNNANAGNDFFWTPETFVTNNGQPSITVNLDETTTFTVFETDQNNCEGSTTATVNIVPAIPEIPDVVEGVCEGDVFNITTIPVNDFYTYIWTSNAGNTDGLSCSDCPNPTVTINGSVQYELVVSDASGTCSEQSATFMYNVPEENQVAMPNAFRPNGDEANDYFNYVINNESANVNVIVFQVFDRFGNMVYNNETPTTGWDGMTNGKLANSDVYLYNIELSIDECVSLEFQGDVTLIR